MEETALQYCQRLIDLITLGDKDISIKQRLIHLKNKIEDESRPVQAGVMPNEVLAGEQVRKEAEESIYPDPLDRHTTKTAFDRMEEKNDMLEYIFDNFNFIRKASQREA